MKRLLFFLSLPLLTFILSSCAGKKNATGSEDKIYVVADSLEFQVMASVLDSVFGKIIYTPQPEKSFELIRRDFYMLEDLKTLKNVIIMAPLNSNSIVSQYVNSILDSTVKQKVQADSEFVFNKYDLWAVNQLVMVLTAPDLEKLKNRMLQEKENLLYYFQKISNRRLAEGLYNDKYENKEAEAKFLNDYGWMIYVQTDFSVALNKPEDNFVWLRRAPNSEMERWVFVHWIENASPEFLNPDSIRKERNKITEKFYKTSDEKGYVQISEDFLTSSEVNFLGRYAILTQGLWEMSDRSMGGPFINYTFYDMKTRRVYMVDGSIYAPRYYKKALIQQVDVLLQSFMTKDEMKEDQKKEILNALNK